MQRQGRQAQREQPLGASSADSAAVRADRLVIGSLSQVPLHSEPVSPAEPVALAEPVVLAESQDCFQPAKR